ncbi:MAG: phosphoglycerate dehydrogenase [Planctomycetota bacterium]
MPPATSAQPVPQPDGPTTSFPKDQIRVVLLESVHARGIELFERETFQVRAFPKALEGDELAEAIREAHLVGIRSKTQLDLAALGAAHRLLAIGCFCIGVNQVDLGSARAAGVPVFNSPFSNTRSVAELVIAEVIALHRQLFDRSAAMHAGRWDKSASGAHEIRGRTLGIVGYGHIGSQVSVLAEAMGMRVLYHDLVPKLPLGNAQPTASLDALLAESDVVTLHVPATPDTERLIGERELGLMRPGASLINNARGGVVDLAALSDALEAGRLSGAALDVFPEEPASKTESFDAPVRGRANVILTPHIGGSTMEAQSSIAEDVATKLVRFINNGSTTGAVNVPNVELPSQSRVSATSASGPAIGPRPHRLLHFHRNVPGVLGKMHAIISELGANVAGEYLRTDEAIGYVVLDVDPTNATDIAGRLRQIPETIRVRTLW